MNDAARAVNRLDSLEVKTITPESLTELLGIEGILVTSFALEELADNEHVHLVCEHEHSIAIYPCCGQVSTNIHDTKPRSVRYSYILNNTTIIHFTRRRFECSKCDKPFTENVPFLDPKRRQTRAFKKYIYECMKKNLNSRRVLHNLLFQAKFSVIQKLEKLSKT